MSASEYTRLRSARTRTDWLCVIASCVIGLGPGIASASDASNREWRFNVTLDGRPIGSHRFFLREYGQRKELSSEARFNVRILFFDAYRYEHHAREIWDGSCLESIDARTNDNGDESTVRGARDDGVFRLATDSFAGAIGSCVQTFAYWSQSLLDAGQLLNPQTGEYVATRLEPIDREPIVGLEHADGFRLSGENADGTRLQIDLWYSASGEWLALESRTPDGRQLRYVLE